MWIRSQRGAERFNPSALGLSHVVSVVTGHLPAPPPVDTDTGISIGNSARLIRPGGRRVTGARTAHKGGVRDTTSLEPSAGFHDASTRREGSGLPSRESMQRPSLRNSALVAAAALTLALGGAPLLVTGADHLDAPALGGLTNMG